MLDWILLFSSLVWLFHLLRKHLLVPSIRQVPWLLKKDLGAASWIPPLCFVYTSFSVYNIGNFSVFSLPLPPGHCKFTKAKRGPDLFIFVSPTLGIMWSINICWMEKQLSHLIPGVVSFFFKTGHNICSLFFTWQILAMTEWDNRWQVA